MPHTNLQEGIGLPQRRTGGGRYSRNTAHIHAGAPSGGAGLSATAPLRDTAPIHTTPHPSTRHRTHPRDTAPIHVTPHPSTQHRTHPHNTAPIHTTLHPSTQHRTHPRNTAPIHGNTALIQTRQHRTAEWVCPRPRRTVQVCSKPHDTVQNPPPLSPKLEYVL